MLETIRAANHVNPVHPIGESFADVMLKSTKVMTPYSPSMKLDFDHKRPMEIKYIYSRPIEEAAKAGFKMSKVEMLEAQLKFIEKEYLQR
jgi:2-dehydropantoate 2-reductase